jgi:hypothetical protein
MEKTSLSILQQVSKAEFSLVPFPHLIIKDALEPSLYAALERDLPSEELVVDGREVRDTWYDYPACKVKDDPRISPLWREFFAYHVSAAFFAELLRVAGGILREIYPDLERRAQKRLEDFVCRMRPGGRGDPLAEGADISLECQFYVNYTRQPRTVRGPHVDRPSELFAALLYFRQKDDSSSGGDLQICAAQSDRVYPAPNRVRIAELPAEIDPAAVQIVRPVAYQPNTLVLFLNSAKSIHSVSPRTPTNVTRRHINFCGDLRFDLFSMELPPKLKLRRALQDMPLGWRLAHLLR